MAKKANKYRVLRVGGKSYKIRVTVNALADFEQAINEDRAPGDPYIGFFQVAQAMQRNEFTMQQVRALLWASLLEEHGDEEISLLEAGEILGECGLQRAMTVLGDAIADQFGDGGTQAVQPVQVGAGGGS